MMDILQLLNIFNQNNTPQNQPQQNTNNIPQDVLNSYPSEFVDRPTNSQKVNYQTLQPNTQLNNQHYNQHNGIHNNPTYNQHTNSNFQKPLSMLTNILPSIMKGNPDITNLIGLLSGGGKTNILSNLLNNKKPIPKKSQQKNSPNYDELKKVDDYEFGD